MNEAMHALNRLLEMQNDLERYGTSGQFSISEQRKILNAIEKALKALGIIKQYIHIYRTASNDCGDVRIWFTKDGKHYVDIPQEEYDLLNETFE